jgi:hypothetical protein
MLENAWWGSEMAVVDSRMHVRIQRCMLGLGNTYRDLRTVEKG